MLWPTKLSLLFDSRFEVPCQARLTYGIILHEPLADPHRTELGTRGGWLTLAIWKCTTAEHYAIEWKAHQEQQQLTIDYSLFTALDLHFIPTIFQCPLLALNPSHKHNGRS